MSDIATYVVLAAVLYLIVRLYDDRSSVRKRGKSESLRYINGIVQAYNTVVCEDLDFPIPMQESHPIVKIVTSLPVYYGTLAPYSSKTVRVDDGFTGLNNRQVRIFTVPENGRGLLSRVFGLNDVSKPPYRMPIKRYVLVVEYLGENKGEGVYLASVFLFNNMHSSGVEKVPPSTDFRVFQTDWYIKKGELLFLGESVVSGLEEVVIRQKVGLTL